MTCIEALPEEGPKETLPIVILCHGFAYYKEEDGIFTSLAERLTGLGYAVYYFDFSGCGESEGDYEQTSLTKLVGDLKTILNEVCSYDYTDENDVSLVGQSFGTTVSIATQLTNIKRMALCGAFFNPYTLIAKLFTEFNETGVSRRVRDDGRITTVGPQFWKDLEKYELEKLVANFDCPILFVHGEKDNIVPPENVRPLLQNAKDSKLFIVADSDHGLQPNREQALEAIEEFFRA